MTEKFCQDCRFATRNAVGLATEASGCQHPNAVNQTTSLVTGDTWQQTTDAARMRELTGAHFCGPDAKLFEPRIAVGP